MHDLYLGVGPDVVASCLVELVEFKLVPDATDPYKWLSLEFQRYCKQRRISCSAQKFDPTSLNRHYMTDMPVLSSKFKASHTKIILGFCAHISCKLYPRRPDWRSQLRCTCMWALAKFIHVLDRSGPWLTDREALEAWEAGQLYLDCHQHLADMALKAGQMFWKVRPKTHYMCHHVDDCYNTRMNPRFLSCWIDEDFVGKLAKVGRACHRKTCSERTLQRYLLFLHAHWRVSKQ